MADAERARLLLHWINSLPLTNCLLVDDLADLRFGDVLADIARWVQHRRRDVWGERQGGLGVLPTIDQQGVVERVRAVVQLAASECRSADGDAVFVLNSADCVAHVMEGDCSAIGAVVSVFKRLSHQLPPQPRRRSSPTASDKLRALQKTLAEEEASKPRELERTRTKEKHDILDKATLVLRAGPPRSSRAPADIVRSISVPAVETAQPKPAEPGLTVKKKRTGSKLGACKPRSSTSGPAKRSTSVTALTTNSHNQPLLGTSCAFHDEMGLHVFGMLDPTAKSKDARRATTVTSDCDDEMVRRAHQWLTQSLGIELPLEHRFSDTRQQSNQRKQPPRRDSRRSARAQACPLLKPFQDGVLLCQIAAAALRLAGRDNQSQQSAAVGWNTSDMDTVSLRGFERNPRTRADSIRNIALARSVFRRLGVPEHSLTALEDLGNSSSPLDVPAVWRVLDELRDIYTFHGFALRGTTSIKATGSTGRKAVKAGKRLPCTEQQCSSHDSGGGGDLHEPCADAVKSRGYISAEQCAAVDDWLSALEIGVEKNSRGVLQDALRNGVLLCSLRPHVFPAEPSPCAYYKTPRSLMEARENITRALRDVSDLLPISVRDGYTGAQAVEDILLGDRQVVYGLLWHLWQHSKARQDRNDQEIYQSGDAEMSTVSSEVRPTPIMLDVPAIALAEEDDRLRRSTTDGVSAKRLIDTRESSTEQREIAGEPQTSDDGDIFPMRSEDVGRDNSHPEDPVTDESEDVAIQVSNLRKESAPAGESRTADGALPTVQDRPLLRVVTLHTLKRQLNLQRQPSPVQVDQQQLVAAEKQVDTILLWLKGLSIRLERPDVFQDPSAALTEFQSGVLLCRIVEKVEYMRGVPGVVAPKAGSITRASALHNIKKALAIFQHKKTMPLHLLRRASSIYKGDRATILCLLVEIRKAYGHHHTIKPKSHLDALQVQTDCDPTVEPQHDAAAIDAPDNSNG